MFVDQCTRDSSVIVAMASNDSTSKGKAPIESDDEEVLQEWLERKIPVLPQFPESW